MEWAPQPGPQKTFVDNPCFEVVYGGARGGGKTDAALGDFARHARRFGGGARGLLVRRTRVALEPTIARAREIYVSEGAKWSETRSSFEWSSGAVLYFRHLDRDADAQAYQGHAYTRVYVEELTQFPRPDPVDKLKATLRSAAGVPCGFRATCNPGGPGHAWVKARHIDPGPNKMVWEDFTSPFDGTMIKLSRLFIPARLTDNPALLANDPSYVARLQLSGSKALVKAWLEGDWNAVEGAFFDNWSERNIVAPFEIPYYWNRFRSLDWGFATPFSAGWWAVVSEDCRTPSKLLLQRGALIRYQEWYGRGRHAREGLRLPAEQVAAGILARDGVEAPEWGVADPSIFARTSGPSIGERMAIAGLPWRPGDNTRVGGFGALSGWDQMRARIAGSDKGPMLMVFDTCRDFIRTVPALQHDTMRAEDLDTDAEDHVADETRYACLSRPLPSPSPHGGPHRPAGWDWDHMRRARDIGQSWKTL